MKPKLIIIVGPTAVGKSQLALELARRIKGEILVADSMQVYRYLDIGTAKPTRQERALIPHHLVDIIDPNEDFSAAQFQNRAGAVISRLHEQEKNIILCGGTGLYIKTLLGGIFSGPEGESTLRQTLRKQEAEHGEGYLYAQLEKVDPISALRLHPRDVFRIIRALEIYHLTGRTMSELQNRHAFQDRRYQYLQIGLSLDRTRLYERIDQRCDQMLSEGLVGEVQSLLDRGYHRGLKSMQSLGYRQVSAYLQGELTLEEAIMAIKRDTRHYAKRQLTWFRADPGVRWVDPSEDPWPWLEETVTNFLSSRES